MSVDIRGKFEVASNSDAKKIHPKDVELFEWMNNCIYRLQKVAMTPNGSITQFFPYQEIATILRLTDHFLMAEPSLLDLSAPIKIVGDLNGQFTELMHLFQLIGKLPEEKVLFLGNYVDLGLQGMETFVFLCCLKIRYRDRVFLLRGNHELPAVNKLYNFYTECTAKYGTGCWWDFQCTFNRLPLAAVVEKKVFCVHGGISPNIASMRSICEIVRPVEPIDSGLAIDLLWSDPTNRGDGWFRSLRGVSYMFGKQTVEDACQKLGVDLIIRSHMVVQDGYEVMVGRRLITVFSTRNFMGTVNNSAAIICLSPKLEITYQQLPCVAEQGGAPVQPSTIDPSPAAAQRDKNSIKLFVKW